MAAKISSVPPNKRQVSHQDEGDGEPEFERSLSIWKGRLMDSNAAKGVEDDHFSPTPLDLYTAASLGQYDVVRDIISMCDKKDLSKKNRGGWTALMYASYIGHDNVLDLLLEGGSRVNAINLRNQTALMLAACCGNESIAYTLLQYGADLEARDSDGKTALFHAVSNGHHTMSKFLLDQGANGEVREKKVGLTPLMEAAFEGHERIVEDLLAMGVNPSSKLTNGHSPRTLAVMQGNHRIVALLDHHSRQRSSTEGTSLKNPLLRGGSPGHRKNEAAVRHPSKSPSILDGPQKVAMRINKQTSQAPVSVATTSLDDNNNSYKDGDKGGSSVSTAHFVRDDSSSSSVPPSTNLLPQSSSLPDLPVTIDIESSSGQSSLGGTVAFMDCSSNTIRSNPCCASRGSVGGQMPSSTVLELMDALRIAGIEGLPPTPLDSSMPLKTSSAAFGQVETLNSPPHTVVVSQTALSGRTQASIGKRKINRETSDLPKMPELPYVPKIPGHEEAVPTITTKAPSIPTTIIHNHVKNGNSVGSLITPSANSSNSYLNLIDGATQEQIMAMTTAQAALLSGVNASATKAISSALINQQTIAALQQKKGLDPTILHQIQQQQQLLKILSAQQQQATKGTALLQQQAQSQMASLLALTASSTGSPTNSPIDTASLGAYLLANSQVPSTQTPFNLGAPQSPLNLSTSPVPTKLSNEEANYNAQASSPAGFVDLADLLESIQCSKYLKVFEEQDVDLATFLTLTDSDLKEVGIHLLGPRKKMTGVITKTKQEGRRGAEERANEAKLNELNQQVMELTFRCSELRTSLKQKSETQLTAEGRLREERDRASSCKATLMRAVDKGRTARTMARKLCELASAEFEEVKSSSSVTTNLFSGDLSTDNTDPNAKTQETGLSTDSPSPSGTSLVPEDSAAVLPLEVGKIVDSDGCQTESCRVSFRDCSPSKPEGVAGSLEVGLLGRAGALARDAKLLQDQIESIITTLDTGLTAVQQVQQPALALSPTPVGGSLHAGAYSHYDPPESTMGTLGATGSSGIQQQRANTSLPLPDVKRHTIVIKDP